MAGNRISVVLTEDIIKFVKLLKVQKFSENKIGFDFYSLYPESHLFYFISHIKIKEVFYSFLLQSQ